MNKKSCLLMIPALAGMLLLPLSGAEQKNPLDGFRFNHLKTYYTGKIYPAPQKAKYSNRSVKLSKAALVLPPGRTPDDIRFRYLRDRIEMNGGTAEIVSRAPAGSTAVISGRVSKTDAPAKPEGYRIDYDQAGNVTVTGADERGLLWGMASLAQMIRRDGDSASLMLAKVEDWPDVPKRGFLTTPWAEIVPEYMILGKFNTVIFQKAHYIDDYGWRNFPQKARRPSMDRWLSVYGEFASQAGLDIRDSVNPLEQYGDIGRRLLCGSEDDYQKVLEHARYLNSIKLGMYLAFDDHRFPASEEDLKQFGSARKADVYFVNRLFGDMKKVNPDFRLCWCPPFYWGPASKAMYPEDRQEYLSEAGAEINPEIDFFWTGPSVGFSPPSKAHVKWVKDLYRRAPWTFINGKQTGHMYTYNYITDPVKWWHDELYPGFWNDMGAAVINTNMWADAESTLLFGHAVWNGRNYIPGTAVRNAVDMTFGPGNFEKLDALNKAMSAFDPYAWTVTAGAARRLPELERNLKVLEKAYAEVEKANPDALGKLSSFRRWVDLTERFVKKLRDSKQLLQFSQTSETVMADAAKENKLTPRDIVIPSSEFVGGKGPIMGAPVPNPLKTPKRLVMCIYGKKTPCRSMETAFTCSPFPVTGDYRLVVSGLDDESKNVSKIEILVNGKVIFSGPNGFRKDAWSLREFKIPAEVLSRENKLRISSAEDSDRSYGPPWFLLNYVIVKPSGK